MSRRSHSRDDFATLDDAELAEASGGASYLHPPAAPYQSNGSNGLYFTWGAQAGGNGKSYTVDSHLNLYETTSRGIGNSASEYVGAGVYHSDGTPQDYFTGPGTGFSLGADAVAAGGSVSAAWNNHGAQAGAEVGPSVTAGPVSGSVQDTNTQQITWSHFLGLDQQPQAPSTTPDANNADAATYGADAAFAAMQGM